MSHNTYCPIIPAYTLYIGIVMDEVHVKDDLVYDKHSGRLIGFTNLGDTNNCLLQFESSLTNDAAMPSLANTMLVLMISNLCSICMF